MHCVVADPPYVIADVMSTSPVGIVTGEAAATQVGSAGVRVTATPGDGAAMGDPPLSNLTVIVLPNVSSMVSDPCVMFRAAVVDTVDWACP